MSHLHAYTMADYFQRKTVNDTIGKVFDKAAKDRAKRSEFVPDPSDNTTVPGWVIYERGQMLAAVNAERAKLGKPPIEERTLLRVENCAKGHIDYARKYILYATELVFDDWRGP